MITKKLFTFFLLFSLIACGSSGGNNPTGDDDDDNDNDTDDSINTEKLVGTPFEGMTTGDDFGEDHFNCGDYATRTIESFPIQIFAAFFTSSEESIIQEGMDVANEGIGFDAYELTNEWSDSTRAIYKVEVLEGARGKVNGFFKDMEKNGGAVAAWTVAADWEMLLTDDGTNKWTIAHEFGHATGITRHGLIDYDNDRWLDLEENSLMGTDRVGEPALDDYNYMMEMQGQLMQDYLGEEGTRLGTNPCT